MSARAIVRGDWEGFAVYLESPGQTEPGECVGVFLTLTGAARAATAADAALAELSVLLPLAKVA